jgi:hypothetical protein
MRGLKLNCLGRRNKGALLRKNGRPREETAYVKDLKS